jgi:hypothetical protein
MPRGDVGNAPYLVLSVPTFEDRVLFRAGIRTKKHTIRPALRPMLGGRGRPDRMA